MHLASSAARRIIDLLDLNWLTANRLAPYGLLVFVLYVLVIGNGVIRSGGARSDLLVDFRAFWTAGLLVLRGDAAAPYDWIALQQAMDEALGRIPGGVLAWLNPPTFFFVVAPLALLPFEVAWSVWLGFSLVVFVAAIWTIVPRWGVVVAGLLTPAALLCATVGQNGFLTAALLASTLAWLDKGPTAAGISLGLLTYKPQFGILFPLLLLLTSRWRVLVVAILTGVAVTTASLAVFGWESWAAFLRSTGPNADRMLGSAAAVKMQSVYSCVVRLGGPTLLAAVVHVGVALPAVWLTLRLWRRSHPAQEEVRAVATLAATFLLSPYGHVYDSVALAVAPVFVVRAARRNGFLPFERIILILACLAPGLVLVSSVNLITPIAWQLILYVAYRRARIVASPA